MRSKRWVYLVLAGLLLSLAATASADTMGYQGAGTATDNFSMLIKGTVFVAGTSFYATHFKAYITSSDFPGNTMRVAIYDVNDLLHYPVNVLWSSSPQLIQPLQWNDFYIAPAVPLTAGKEYYLALMFQDSASIAVDTSASGMQSWERGEAAIFPDPFGNSTAATSWQYCLYVEGPASEPTFTPTPTYTRTPTFTRTFTPTPTFTRTPTYTRTVTPTFTISPTFTQSPTRTSTMTFTATPTKTRTSTITLTITPTPSVVTTATSTRTPYVLPEDEVIVYPSPGQGDTLWFYYSTPGPADVRVELFNVTGEPGSVLSQRDEAAGRQRLAWDIRNVAPGVYFYRLTQTTGAGRKDFGMRKLVIIRK
jgi:hypothetical protein